MRTNRIEIAERNQVLVLIDMSKIPDESRLRYLDQNIEPTTRYNFGVFLDFLKREVKSRQTSSLLAANIERRLGRFDKAQARLKQVAPHLKAAVFKRVAAQIDGWAAKKNDKPQKFIRAPKKSRK